MCIPMCVVHGKGIAARVEVEVYIGAEMLNNGVLRVRGECANSRGGATPL